MLLLRGTRLSNNVVQLNEMTLHNKFMGATREKRNIRTFPQALQK